MITKEHARAIAEQYVNEERKYGVIYDAVITKEQETEAGWGFNWCSERYHVTGDMRYLYPGTLPLFVDRYYGEIHLMAMGKTFEEFSAEFERARVDEIKKDI